MNAKAIKRLSAEYVNWIKIFAERFRREFNIANIDYWNWDYYVSTVLKATLTIKNSEALEAIKDHIEAVRAQIPSTFGQLLALLAQSGYYIYGGSDQKENHKIVREILNYELDFIQKDHELTDSMKQTLYFYAMRYAILLYGETGKIDDYTIIKTALSKLTHFSTRIIFLIDLLLELKAFKLLSRIIHEIPHYRPKERIETKYKILNDVLRHQNVEEMMNLDYFAFKFFEPGSTQYLHSYKDDSELWYEFDEAHSILLWFKISIAENNCSLSEEYAKRKDRLNSIIKKNPEIAKILIPRFNYLNLIYLTKSNENPNKIRALEEEFHAMAKQFDAIDMTIIYTDYGIELCDLDDPIKIEEAFARALTLALNIKDGIEGESEEEDTVNCKNLLTTIEYLNVILFQVKEPKAIQKLIDEFNQMEISGSKILKNFPKKQRIEDYSKFLRKSVQMDPLQKLETLMQLTGVPQKMQITQKTLETIDLSYLEYELLFKIALLMHTNGKYNESIEILSFLKTKFQFEIQPRYSLAEIAFEINDIYLAANNYIEIITILPYHYGAKKNLINLLQNFSLKYDPIYIRPEFKIFKEMYQFAQGNLQLEYFSSISNDENQNEMKAKERELIEITPESLNDALVFFTDEYGKSIINTDLSIMNEFSLKQHEEEFIKKTGPIVTVQTAFNEEEQSLLKIKEEEFWSPGETRDFAQSVQKEPLNENAKIEIEENKGIKEEEYFKIEEELDLTEKTLIENPDLEKRLEELKKETDKKLQEGDAPFAIRPKPFDFGIPKEKQHSKVKFMEVTQKSDQFLILPIEKEKETDKKQEKKHPPPLIPSKNKNDKK
mgnify:CR=1 FL=1